MNSRHPDPRRVWKGGSEQRFLVSGVSAGSGGSVGIRFCVPNPVFFVCVLRHLRALTPLRCNVFLTFSEHSRLKFMVLRPLLENHRPKTVSKVQVLAERGMKKSKTYHAIAPARSSAMFFVYFFRPFSSKTCGFETMFRQ